MIVLLSKVIHAPGGNIGYAFVATFHPRESPWPDAVGAGKVVVTTLSRKRISESRFETGNPHSRSDDWQADSIAHAVFMAHEALERFEKDLGRVFAEMPSTP